MASTESGVKKTVVRVRGSEHEYHAASTNASEMPKFDRTLARHKGDTVATIEELVHSG